MAIIYGVDTDKPVTPVHIRDAIVTCFNQAHCQNTGITGTTANPQMEKEYCQNLVKKMFVENGDDFEKPTKESLLKVVEKLAQFSTAFRDPTIINEHKQKILELIKLLPIDTTL